MKLDQRRRGAPAPRFLSGVIRPEKVIFLCLCGAAGLYAGLVLYLLVNG